MAPAPSAPAETTATALVGATPLLPTPGAGTRAIRTIATPVATATPAATATVPAPTPPATLGVTAAPGRLVTIAGLSYAALGPLLAERSGLQCAAQTGVAGALAWICAPAAPGGDAELTVVVDGSDPEHVAGLTAEPCRRRPVRGLAERGCRAAVWEH